MPSAQRQQLSGIAPARPAPGRLRRKPPLRGCGATSACASLLRRASREAQVAGTDPLPINLALQGGGSHGAFTWGALERIFTEPSLRVDSISGTSAGAMNAGVFASGYTNRGASGGIAALERFWRDVSDAARFSPLQRTPFDVMSGNWSLAASPGYVFYDVFSRLFSPYQSNPANLNPLRDSLEENVDLASLRDCPIKLFINATNVRT
ncbi:MAG: patatin-like phospholipase family protein, partial [Candidatus Accumulibacter sp.]|nr:patatin-like phospholipase family protein [Accumulibacter sp.]